MASVSSGLSAGTLKVLAYIRLRSSTSCAHHTPQTNLSYLALHSLFNRALCVCTSFFTTESRHKTSAPG